MWTAVLFSKADVKRNWPSPGTRRRGPQSAKFELTKEAMRADINQKKLTRDELKEMPGKKLADRYKVSRTTATSAREAVLKELILPEI
jgi:hypothetical protein